MFENLQRVIRKPRLDCNFLLFREHSHVYLSLQWISTVYNEKLSLQYFAFSHHQYIPFSHSPTKPFFKMKTTSLLLTLASVHGAFSSVFPRAECKADTCLRGVPGNEVAEQPLSLRQADCSTYMTRYVSPSPT